MGFDIAYHKTVQTSSTKKYHIDKGFFLRHSFANKGIAAIKLEHTRH
jgi:hypothetical protein